MPRAVRLLVYLFLAVAAVVMLTPLVWLVAACVKHPDDLFSYLFFPPPGRLSLANFRDLFDLVPFERYLMNSLFVTSAAVMIQLFLSSLGGFALAK